MQIADSSGVVAMIIATTNRHQSPNFYYFQFRDSSGHCLDNDDFFTVRLFYSDCYLDERQQKKTFSKCSHNCLLIKLALLAGDVHLMFSFRRYSHSCGRVVAVRMVRRT